MREVDIDCVHDPAGSGEKGRPTMEKQEHTSGWCCVDCLMLLANGETPPEMDEEETAAYLARIDDDQEITLGMMFGASECNWNEDEETEDEHREHHAEDCEQVSFSWSPCDVCGSHLGGSREAVTFWFPAVAVS